MKKQLKGKLEGNFEVASVVLKKSLYSMPQSQKRMTIHTPLNEAQLTLLRLFSMEMSAQELEALRKVLMTFYEQELQKELDRVIADKKLQPKDFEKRLNKQQRTAR